MGERTMLAIALALGAASPCFGANASGKAGPLALRGDGVTAGTTIATFGATPKAQAIALVTAVLGRPVRQGSHGDCGQDEIITYATFRGGFELSFVAGKLAGWTADGTAPRTTAGVAVGTTLAALRKAYPDVETDPGDEANGGLGAGFQREGGPNGWLDGTGPRAKVSGLYAGATCIVG